MSPFSASLPAHTAKHPRRCSTEKLGSQDKNFLLQLDHIEDGTALQDTLEEIMSQRSAEHLLAAKEYIGGSIYLQVTSGLSRLVNDKQPAQILV